MLSRNRKPGAERALTKCRIMDQTLLFLTEDDCEINFGVRYVSYLTEVLFVVISGDHDFLNHQQNATTTGFYSNSV